MEGSNPLYFSLTFCLVFEVNQWRNEANKGKKHENFKRLFLTAEIEDISTASSTFVAVPDGGRIIKIITALQGAISGANAGISFEIGGTAVTGGITVAHSGSAAGDC